MSTKMRLFELFLLKNGDGLQLSTVSEIKAQTQYLLPASFLKAELFFVHNSFKTCPRDF